MISPSDFTFCKPAKEKEMLAPAVATRTPSEELPLLLLMLSLASVVWSV